jgi:DNA-binding beta-propeller fold protein YncE
MRTDRRIRLQKLVTGTLIIAACYCLGGQDPVPVTPGEGGSNYAIEWISQYPATRTGKESKEERKRNRKNSRWFSDLIFGKKPDVLVKPMSVVAIGPDSYWVADQGTGSILQVCNQMGEIIQFKETPFESIPSMVGSCLMPDRKILFTDSRLNKIFLFVPGNNELRILNDTLTLAQPTGIAYSVVNNQIWVVETSAHRIAVLNDRGELIRHIGGRGNMPGKFNFPTYIWVDGSGTAYVVDAMNFRIQIFDKEGAFLSAFGEIGDASGYFARPKGIATDSFGHIYVSDALFHVVQVFDRAGTLLHTFGSRGQEKEQFWMPTGLFIDQENFIYIADSYNSRVQVFHLTSED